MIKGIVGIATIIIRPTNQNLTNFRYVVKYIDATHARVDIEKPKDNWSLQQVVSKSEADSLVSRAYKYEWDVEYK